MDNAFKEIDDIDQDSLSSVSSADINQMNVSMDIKRWDNLEKNKSRSIDSCADKSQLRDANTYDSMYKFHDKGFMSISPSPIGIPQTLTKVVKFPYQRSTPIEFKKSHQSILDLSRDEIQRKCYDKMGKRKDVLIANLKNNMKSKGLADIAKDIKQKINIFKKSLEESEEDIESLLSKMCRVRSIGTGTINSVLNVSGKNDFTLSGMGNADFETWRSALGRVLIELMKFFKEGNEKSGNSGMKNSILRSGTVIERVSNISILSSDTFLSREGISSKACNQSQDMNIERNDLHESQNSNSSKTSNSTAMQPYDDSFNHRDTIGTDGSEKDSESPTRTTTMISEVESDENDENKSTNNDTAKCKTNIVTQPEKRWETVKEKNYFNGALQVSQLKNYSANSTVRVSAANMNNQQQKSQTCSV